MADKPSISTKSRKRGSNNRRHCCVPGCCSSGYRDPNRRLSFHLFPLDKEARKEWVISIYGREEGQDIKISASTTVCCDHFLPSDMKKGLSGTRIDLRKGAVPCVFDCIDKSQPKKKNSQTKSVPRPKRKPLSVDVKTVETETGDASLSAPILSDHDYAVTVSPEDQLKSGNTPSEQPAELVVKIDADVAEEDRSQSTPDCMIQDPLRWQDAEDANSESDVANTQHKMQASTSLADNKVSKPTRKPFNCHRMKTELVETTDEPANNKDGDLFSRQNNLDETNHYSDDEYELPVTFDVRDDLKSTDVPKEGKSSDNCFQSETGATKKRRHIHNENHFESETDIRMCHAESSESISLTNRDQDQLSRHKQNEEEPSHEILDSDLAISSDKTTLNASPSPRTLVCDIPRIPEKTALTPSDHACNLPTTSDKTMLTPRSNVCDLPTTSGDNNTALTTSPSATLHVCKLCNMSYPSPLELHFHLMTHNGKKAFQCDECDMSFTYDFELSRHIRVHTGYKPFACKICNKAFRLPYSLKKHHLIHTGQKPFQCDQCDKSFLEARNLAAHKLDHTGVRLFECAVCSKKFLTKANLKKHELIHSRVKEFQCDVCGKSFTQFSSLKLHKLIHSDEKAFACDLCDRTFNFKGSLNKHKEFHTEQNHYQCDVCFEFFSLPEILEKHKLIHFEREKPLECNVCQKRYLNASSLKSHMLLHSGQDKLFVCEVCDWHFARPNHLKEHMLVHTGEKPHVCEVCGERFTWKNGLTKHLLIHGPQNTLAVK